MNLQVPPAPPLPDPAQTETMPACLGQMVRSWSGALEGWCYVPARLHERITVEITANGAVIATITASEPHPSLKAAGIGDGRYGFTFRLPASLSRHAAFTVIEARERLTETVFGRVLLNAARQTHPATPQLDRTVRRLEACFDRAERIAPPPGRILADRLHDLGRLMLGAARRGGPPGQPGIALGHQAVSAIPLLDLGFQPDPAVSVILPAALDWKVTAAALRHLATALRGGAAEFVVLDDGADPVTSLLATRLRHLVTLRHHGPAAAAVNAAALACRGGRLLLVDGTHGHGMAAALASLAESVIVGPDIAGNLRRAEESVLVDTIEHKAARTGLQLCIARRAFLDIGGLDESDAQPWPDFLERARMLGLSLIAWQEPERLR